VRNSKRVAVTVTRTKSLICILFALVMSSMASAQDVQRIAAIVNDQVISGFDVEQRMKLVLASTQLRDTPDVRRRLRREILLRLVDEQLQLEAAKKQNISVSERDIDQAFKFMAGQNNVPPEKFEEQLRSGGVPRHALEAQVRAEIAWSKLINRQLARNVLIGDDEIDEAIQHLKKTANEPAYNISEILLPVDNPDDEAEVYRTASRLLAEIRGGASFKALAQQFSRGATAQQGGAIGWVQADQLPSEISDAIANLAEGQISEVIRAPGGMYLIAMNRKREGRNSGGATELDLKRFVLKFDADKARTAEQAEKLRATTRGCEAIEPLAKQLDVTEYGDLGRLKLADMPPNIQERIRDLEIGEFSTPIETETGLMMIMVCGREKAELSLPDREAIRERLTRERLAVLAQRYMRDLRRDAVVELR
jgi:peptidyl-prolyl cis-trans isomerase SurA